MANENLFIKKALDAWQTQLKRTDELFDSLPDEELMKEVAPGRNRGIYLLGHLTAIHDRMLPLLGLCEPLHPELWDPFVESPDKTVADLPNLAELRRCWKEVNAELANKISGFSPFDWFQKHGAVSAKDFAKEPHRNKLNIIINRTSHLATHYGQLLLLKRREA
jgi:hypothetical protein